MSKRLWLAALAAGMPTVAHAHVGIGDVNGFGHGFAHPLGGIDHILAMIAVGVLAAQIGGRALWLVPLSFVGMMIVGGVLGAVGADLPYAEIGIGLSVIVFGLVVALGAKLAISVAMALVGFFAVFHGYTHGAEMPETSSGMAYGAGFVVATAVLHVLGIGCRFAIGNVGASHGRRITQIAGGAVAAVGVAIVSGIF